MTSPDAPTLLLALIAEQSMKLGPSRSLTAPETLAYSLLQGDITLPVESVPEMVAIIDLVVLGAGTQSVVRPVVWGEFWPDYSIEDHVWAQVGHTLVLPWHPGVSLRVPLCIPDGEGVVMAAFPLLTKLDVGLPCDDPAVRQLTDALKKDAK
jgi:hypothetical protein